MSKRLLIIYILGLILLFFIARGIYHHFAGAGNKFPPTNVEVATAKTQMWKDQVPTTGTISAINGIVIKPEVPGRITNIYFTSGTMVKKGDPLFQIYPDILEAQLAAAQSDLALAQVDYDRAAELYQKNVASKQQLDTYTAKLESAQASVDQIKAQLVQNNITAPFSGKIGLKQVDIGDYVNIGESLVPLEEVDPLRIQFSIPDSYINEVDIGDQAAIQVSSSQNKIYMGPVYALNSAVDPDTRMFSVWARIPNPDKKLVPGTYVSVVLFTGQAHPVITVPQTAVIYSPQGQYVFIVKEGKAIKTQVTAGARQGNEVAVTTGLSEGEIVVTAGQVKLFDNSPVVIAKTTTYAPSQTPNVEIITFQGDESLNQYEAKENAKQAPAANTDQASKAGKEDKAKDASSEENSKPQNNNPATNKNNTAPASAKSANDAQKTSTNSDKKSPAANSTSAAPVKENN